ncbi:hypothetical protein A3197_15435 [Candidatus Thiodiazotropha endoloripes]|nr:hypothetical protein A3197_15435 [Candidatus Thiodiazotropha endoloripes]
MPANLKEFSGLICDKATEQPIYQCRHSFRPRPPKKQAKSNSLQTANLFLNLTIEQTGGMLIG